MTNSKTTRKALLSSALALLMCVAMLIATTFAWFTDTASTSVNKIQAGKLDVELYYANNTTGEGAGTTWTQITSETGALQFMKAADGESQEVLWEPGCTYSLPALKIKNNGNLALKYKVMFAATDTNENNLKLAKVLDVTMNGHPADTLYDVLTSTDEDGYAHGTLTGEAETAPITLSVKMDSDAGNEYQGLKIGGIAITVLATQDTVEYDSNSNDYDAEAQYPWDGSVATDEALDAVTTIDATGKTTVKISSAPLLAAFVEKLNKESNTEYANNTTVTLENDINLGGQEWTPLIMYKSGSVEETTGHLTFDGKGNTIFNFKITAATAGDEKTGFFGDATYMTIKNLTISDATVTGYKYVGALVGYGQCTTIENCKVENSTVTAKTWTSGTTTKGSEKVGAVAGALMESPNYVKNCTVTGCTVKGYSEVGGLIGRIAGQWSTVSGNTVSDTHVIWDNTTVYDATKNDTTSADVGEIVGDNLNSAVSISNNTENNVDVTAVAG